MCVLGLHWMELAFDICDCISCSKEALQSTSSRSDGHASIPGKQEFSDKCRRLLCPLTISASFSLTPSNMHNMCRH